MRGRGAASALLFALLLTVALAPRAQANCVSGDKAPTFSTMNPSGFEGYNRIVTPPGSFTADRSVSDAALGYFWSLGYGNPYATAGSPAGPWDNDCGRQADGLGGAATGKCGSPIIGATNDWWIVTTGETDKRSFIGGNVAHWSQDTEFRSTDGCPDWDGENFSNHQECIGCMDLTQCMVVLLADDPDGSEGHYLVLADEGDGASHYALNTAYNGEGVPGFNDSLELVAVPQPENVENMVLATTVTRFELEIDEPPMNGSGGRYEHCPASTAAGGCVAPPASPTGDQTPCHRTVCGYRVYTQVKNPGDPAPDDRNVRGQVGWTKQTMTFDPPSTPACTSVPGDYVPFGVRAGFNQVACEAGKEVYICSTLVLDSGFETPYCSADVVRTCGTECASNAECDDGLYCNGSETCTGGFCEAGSEECDGGTPACDEQANACLPPGSSTAGSVPNGDDIPGGQLLVAKNGSDLTLSWDSQCGGLDYGIYEGEIGEFYSHRSIDNCVDDGTPLTETITPSAFSAYYLVTPLSNDREGSYGTDSSGRERPPGFQQCAPREFGSCE